MSRLAAVAKGLYYRTPDPIAEPLALLLDLPTTGTVRIIDPCAGAGVFLQTLFTRMDVVAQQRGRGAQRERYGIEPNAERAAQAAHTLDHLLQASFFHTRVSKEAFQLAILNPPYDADIEDGDDTESHDRLEIRFLRRTTALLAAEGVLVLIIPQEQLPPAARHLASFYRDIRCWRFPDAAWSPPEEPTAKPTPMYAQFGQIVLMATKRARSLPPVGAEIRAIEQMGYAGAQLPVIPTDAHILAGMARYAVPAAAPDPIEFSDPRFALERVAAALDQEGGGVWSDPDYREQRWPDLDRLRLGARQPLGPLRVGHVITLAAIGLLNGRILTGPDGRQVVVKGACRKEVVRQESTEVSPKGDKTFVTTDTERFVMTLWAIDIHSGELQHIV